MDRIFRAILRDAFTRARELMPWIGNRKDLQ